MNRTATVAGKTIGDGHPVFIVMEMGVTHDGNFDVARDMVTASRRAGADAVKCECIDPDRLVAHAHRGDIEYRYVNYSGQTVVENYYDLLRRVSFSQAQTASLKRVADDVGLPFFGTAFDLPTVDFLHSIDACAIKIASPELRHLPLVRHAASSGLPLFLDTGMATIAEICTGVSTAMQAGAQNVVVMHNPAGYPAPPHRVNLRLIPLLKNVLGVPVGLSCHSRGNAMALAAIAVGAVAVEKPLSKDNTTDGDEHIFSVNLHEVDSYVRELREVEMALGDPHVKHALTEDDCQKRRAYSQSLVTARALPAGHLLAVEDLTTARSGWGLDPDLRDTVVGARLHVALPEGHVLQWSHLVEYAELCAPSRP